MTQPTLADLQAKIAQHAWEDPAFEAEFMADPKAAFEKYAKQSLPADLKVHAHYNTPTELHFVIPKRADAGELTDDDLEKVAGGEVLYTTVVLVVTAALSTSLTASAAVTADQGW